MWNLFVRWWRSYEDGLYSFSVRFPSQKIGYRFSIYCLMVVIAFLFLLFLFIFGSLSIRDSAVILGMVVGGLMGGLMGRESDRERFFFLYLFMFLGRLWGDLMSDHIIHMFPSFGP